MTFRLRHEWIDGAALLGARLATCPHCETLRVLEGEGVTFIRRKLLEDERVSSDEPPCIAPTFFRAPDDGPPASSSPPRAPSAVFTPSADPQGSLW